MITNAPLTPGPAFKKAKEAITTLKSVKRQLSPSELETLALLLDPEAVGTIQKSIGEAHLGQYEFLEDAVKH